MEITKMQQEIEALRKQLTRETNKYRKAIAKDMVLFKVKPLYKKVKSTMLELKIKMVEYEKLISADMEIFDKHKHETD